MPRLIPALGGTTGGRAGKGHIFLYALAYAGAFVSFLPFIAIFLPLKVEAMEVHDPIGLLSLVTIAGAITASIANIIFGMASDWTRSRWGSRRPLIAAGTGGIALAYAFLALATSPAALVLAVIFLQAAINMMFAPLVTIMADEIPDRQKGKVAGILAVAQPAAYMLGSLLLTPPFVSEPVRFGAITFLAIVAILPFCFLFQEGCVQVQNSTLVEGGPRTPRDLAFAWMARLAAQIAGTAVSTYIFLHLRTMAPLLGPAADVTEANRAIGFLITTSTVAAIPAAFLAGWASDRWNSRRPLIALTALGMVAGLCGLVAPHSWFIAGLGHMLFISSYSAFLALHSAFAMEILPSPERRGRDLGIFNLTNTLPALAAPAAMLAIGSGTGLGPLFLGLAAIALLAGVLVLGIGPKRSKAAALL